MNTYTFPKARKAYRCEWCGEEIKEHEVHAKFFGIWENEIQNWRMHLECQEDWEIMPDYYREDGFLRWENERPEK